MKEQIRAYIRAHQTEMRDIICRLTRIPSVRAAAAPGAPFGTACRRVLEETKAIFAEYGIWAELSDDGYLFCDIGSAYADKTTSIGLFAHADVVPAGDGWTLTEPFVPMEKEGVLIGRGVNDNKAGIAAAMLCALAVRDLGLPLRSTIRLFVGANEESGMADIAAYNRVHTPPDASLIPDAGFPVFRGEKGILRICAIGRTPLQVLSDIRGGEAFNIVLKEVTATVDGSAAADALRTYIDANPERLSYRRTVAGVLQVTAEGISAHAAFPAGGLHAGGVLFAALLAAVPLCDSDREQLSFLYDAFTQHDGSPLGIAGGDGMFGANTAASGILGMTEDGRLSVAFDIRYAGGMQGSDVIRTVREALDRHGFDTEVVRDSPGYLIGDGDPMLGAILDTYRSVTGDTESLPRVNGGGTYARCLPHAFSVGTTLCNTVPFAYPMGHGGAHQPDEMLNLDSHAEAAVLLVHLLLGIDRQLHEA